jgi:hypothetical protein
MMLIALAGGFAFALGMSAGAVVMWLRLQRERRAWFEEADRLSVRLIRAESAEHGPVRAVIEREGA